MKRKKGLLLIFTGLLLVAAALFLSIFNLYEDQQAAKSAKRILLELPQKMRTPIPTETERAGEAVLPDYVLNPYMEMPTMEVDGHDYIGILEIPALELELPVMRKWSYPNLKIAPCCYTGSVYLNNIVIAAHNYTHHFGHLKDLKEGDQVVFTDADGNRFTYSVALLETLLPTDVEEMENSEWALTLFTCTIGGAYRITVRCEHAEADSY